MGSFRLRLGRFAHTAILTQGGKVKNPTRRYGVWGTWHPGIRSLAVGIFTARRSAMVGNPSG